MPGNLYPIPAAMSSYTSSSVSRSLSGAICIGLGLGLILSAPTSEEINVDYTDCKELVGLGATCYKNFTLNNGLTGPVYFYYGFNGFYQNHRRYLKYYSATQLSTGTIDVSTVIYL